MMDHVNMKKITVVKNNPGQLVLTIDDNTNTVLMVTQKMKV